MKRCLGCMKEIEEDVIQCPYCGFSDEDYKLTGYSLPLNSILHERYVVGKVIGEGGFGITYIGFDNVLTVPVAIKEYYPYGSVSRNTAAGETEVTVYANSRFGVDFTEGMQRILGEAQTAAKFRKLPGIVSVLDYFQENGTAYIIMEYIDGITLDKYSKENKLSPNELIAKLTPVFVALSKLHEQGIIHRDISPDNIMVNSSGEMVLLDFGAARMFSNEQFKTMSIVLKQSYAPEEQYHAENEQGPWTDIYSLCATMYEVLSGVTPPNSLSRLVADNIVPINTLVDGCPDSVSETIMKGLSVMPADRFRDMHEFMNSLNESSSRTIYVGKPGSTEQLNATSKEAISENKITKKSKKKCSFALLAFVVSVAVLMLAVSIFFLHKKNKGDQANRVDTTSHSEDIISATITQEIDYLASINGKKEFSEADAQSVANPSDQSTEDTAPPSVINETHQESIVLLDSDADETENNNSKKSDHTESHLSEEDTSWIKSAEELVSYMIQIVENDQTESLSGDKVFGPGLYSFEHTYNKIGSISGYQDEYVAYGDDLVVIHIGLDGEFDDADTVIVAKLLSDSVETLFISTRCKSSYSDEDDLSWIESAEELVSYMIQIIDNRQIESLINDSVYGPALISFEQVYKEIGSIHGYQDEYVAYGDDLIVVHVGLDGEFNDADTIIVAKVLSDSVETLFVSNKLKLVQ